VERRRAALAGRARRRGGGSARRPRLPNGRDPADPHYAYKLEWLAALRKQVEAAAVDTAVVAGDFNIAPADPDVYSVEAFAESTHVTPPERAALEALLDTGLHDVTRERWPDERVFTYWDYRGGAFHQDRGMRIDLVLAGGAVARRRAALWVDRQARKGTGPSDHAPVILDLDDAPDGDIGPVVPPPSLGRSRKR
jgi:exodeoxyribonuclease-3